MSSDNMINFDSRDWNSIRDTIDKIKDFGELQVGKTENGETIIFDVCKDDDGNDVLFTSVIQENGFVRKNYYQLSDYSVEELFTRE